MQQKNMRFAFWAHVDTKLLNLSHHFLSMDDWPGDATFSCGANLWRSSASIQPKRSSLLDFIFDTCGSTSSSHFFVGEADHMRVYPFASANISAALQAFHGGIYLLVITFVISELERQEKNEQCGR